MSEAEACVDGGVNFGYVAYWLYVFGKLLTLTVLQFSHLKNDSLSTFSLSMDLW